MKLTADLLVIETTGERFKSYTTGRVGAIKIRAVPYDSNNLVDEISFTAPASEAPRVGHTLKVTIEVEEES